jgi:hypothetical protein
LRSLLCTGRTLRALASRFDRDKNRFWTVRLTYLLDAHLISNLPSYITRIEKWWTTSFPSCSPPARFYHGY